MTKRKIYGVAELAAVIGQDPATVSQWLRRDQLPEPTERLACGPVWLAEDIAAWVKRRATEARLAQEDYEERFVKKQGPHDRKAVTAAQKRIEKSR